MRDDVTTKREAKMSEQIHKSIQPRKRLAGTGDFGGSGVDLFLLRLRFRQGQEEEEDEPQPQKSILRT